MKCKIGDIAYIVRSLNPTNLNRIVEVVAEGPFEATWWVETSGMLESCIGTPIQRGWIKDEKLQPISSKPTETLVETSEELKV